MNVSHSSPTDGPGGRAPQPASPPTGARPATKPPAGPKHTWLLLLILMVIGTALRASHLVDRPLWFDEAWSWHVAHDASYTELLSWRLEDKHAPLSFLVIRPMMELTGGQEPWALRLPSLICGVLCIPAAYLLGRTIRSSGLGLVMALLATVDPNVVDQSQQCRMYSILALLVLLSLPWAIVLLRNPRKNVWHWLGLSLMLGLLLWDQQLGLAVWFGVAGTGAIVFVHALASRQPHLAPGRLVMGLFLAFVVAMALAYPGVRDLLSRAGRTESHHLPLRSIGREIVISLRDLIGWGALGIPVYLAAGVGLLLLYLRCRTSAVLLALTGLANVLLLFPMRQQHHFMDHRYLTPLEPALWAGLAMFAVGWTSKAARGAAMALLLVYIAAQGWLDTYIVDYYQQPDRYLVATETQWVRSQLQPGDKVVYQPAVLEMVGRYYQLTQDVDLRDALYDPTGRERAEPQGLSTIHAPAIWLIVGMVNSEGRWATVRKMLQDMASAQGATLEEADLKRHLRRDHTLVARFSQGRVNLFSMGLEDHPQGW